MEICNKEGRCRTQCLLCVGIDEHGSELLEEDGVQHLAVLGEQRDGMRLPQQLVGLDATQQKKATHTTQTHQLQQIILYYGDTMQPSNEQSHSHKGDTHAHTYKFNAPLRRSIYRRCPGMLAPAVSRGRRYTAVQTTNISSGRGKVRSQYTCTRLVSWSRVQTAALLAHCFLLFCGITSQSYQAVVGNNRKKKASKLLPSERRSAHYCCRWSSPREFFPYLVSLVVLRAGSFVLEHPPDTATC
jgi:hypothetical protein